MITLLTDFGLQDGYVGALKGVLAQRAPRALVVDICHEIPPQDILRAGLVWASAAPYFPKGSIHVAVVDPGVGTSRRILAVRARGSIFLVPDNGLLGYVLPRREVRECVAVRRKRYFLETVSSTFHGRDIFAPVAAALAGGARLEDLGPPASPTVWSGLPPCRRRRVLDGRRVLLEVRGEVVSTDRFGNVLTTIRPAEEARLVSLEVGPHRFRRLARTYGAARPGKALVLVGSTGYLEVAVNQGRADQELGIPMGAPVTVRWELR